MTMDVRLPLHPLSGWVRRSDGGGGAHAWLCEGVPYVVADSPGRLELLELEEGWCCSIQPTCMRASVDAPDVGRWIARTQARLGLCRMPPAPERRNLAEPALCQRSRARIAAATTRTQTASLRSCGGRPPGHIQVSGGALPGKRSLGRAAAAREERPTCEEPLAKSAKHIAARRACSS